MVCACAQGRECDGPHLRGGARAGGHGRRRHRQDRRRSRALHRQGFQAGPGTYITFIFKPRIH